MKREATFGQFFKDRRIAIGKTLRAFCGENGFDPGNISKLERGRLAAPQSQTKLQEYAKALKMRKGSDAWYEFFDLAAAAAGRIPAELLSDEEVVAKLPVLFRGLRGQKIPQAKLKELVEFIRRA